MDGPTVYNHLKIYHKCPSCLRVWAARSCMREGVFCSGEPSACPLCNSSHGNGLDWEYLSAPDNDEISGVDGAW